MGDIMPAEIVRHEWEQHGTCSGLSGDAYLALIRRLASSVNIPGEMKSPRATGTSRPQELKKEFKSANSTLQDEDIAIQTRGNYLNAVEICFSKGQSPAPTACSNVPGRTAATFVIPPVR